MSGLSRPRSAARETFPVGVLRYMKKYGMTREDFQGTRYQRIKTIQKLMSDGRLNSDLRWTESKEAELETAGRRGSN